MNKKLYNCWPSTPSTNMFKTTQMWCLTLALTPPVQENLVSLMLNWYWIVNPSLMHSFPQSWTTAWLAYNKTDPNWAACPAVTQQRDSVLFFKCSHPGGQYVRELRSCKWFFWLFLAPHDLAPNYISWLLPMYQPACSLRWQGFIGCFHHLV